MAHLGYAQIPLLDGGIQRATIPFRRMAAMAGLAIMSGAGWMGRHLMMSSGDSAGGFAHPKDDMKNLVVKPGAPLVALPTGGADGSHCLFSYGAMLVHDTTKKSFVQGSHAEDARLYGAKISGGVLAEITGHEEDVLPGRLLCWNANDFKDRMHVSDQERGFDPANPGKDNVRRGVANVAKKDGSAQKAYWYYYEPMAGEAPVGPKIKVVSWNVGSVNNNPFEFHFSNPNQDYNKLMEAVEDFFTKPNGRDIPVNKVFTEQFYNQLMITMGGKIGWEGTEDVAKIWQEDWSKRKIISGFLLAQDLQTKRLISMPDRVTNTIATPSGPASRPCITSSYAKGFNDMFGWWDQWKEYMFIRGLRVSSTQGSSKKPYELLRPIRSGKYALSAHEEKISLPLQTLALAIYDAIHVHIFNTVAKDTWLSVKKELVDSIGHKADRTMEILTTTYKDYDLICLQEVSSSFVNALSRRLGNEYFTVAPEDMVATRDQNSMLLMRTSRFDSTSVQEITSKVRNAMNGGAGSLGSGDLLSVVVRSRSILGGTPYLITSFHGDQDGQSSIPVLKSIAAVREKTYPRHRMIMGLDANSYEHPTGKQLNVKDFAKAFRDIGLTSSVGSEIDPSRHTTCSARTFLQVATSKAVKMEERLGKGDHNPKDFILFTKDLFKATNPFLDDTGNMVFIKDHVIPTLTFPSDHAIKSVTLAPVRIMKAPIKLIAWDLDGTLAASRSLGYVVTNQVMEKLGYPRISQRDYDLGTAYPTVGRMSFHITKTTTDPIGEVLAKEFDIMTVQTIRDGTSDVVMYPGATQLLEDITALKTPMSILSNGIGPYVDAIVEVNHVAHHFEPRLGADMVPKAKPQPDGLFMISKQKGVDIKNMIYVGDSPSDAKAARNANIPSIGVAWGSHTNEELEAHFDVMCADFYSLREVLVAWGMQLPLKGRELD